MTAGTAVRDGGTAIDAWLAFVWVAVLFSNVPVYLGLFVTPFLQPVHWLALLIGVSAFRVFSMEGLRRRASGLFVGIVVTYGAVCLAWYVAFAGGDITVLKQRLFALLVLLASYAVFIAGPGALSAASRALAVVVVASAVVNVYDISHPFVLVPASSEFASAGRAAGFFVNPNQAGAAIVLGFALSIDRVPARWRTLYAVIAAGGVVLTLSRGAMLGFALVCVVLLWAGSLSRREVVRFAIAITAVGYVGWLFLSTTLESQYQIDPAFIVDRVLWILDPQGRTDFSQAERAQLAELGWQQFVHSPLGGNGLGSTENWQYRSSTHNQYLMLASDFGVLGLLVLPAIVAGAVRPPFRRPGGAAAAGVFVLAWGLLSHNVLTEMYLLVAVALVAATGAPTRVGAAAAQEARSNTGRGMA